jgi:hypothetical protein
MKKGFWVSFSYDGEQVQNQWFRGLDEAWKQWQHVRRHYLYNCIDHQPKETADDIVKHNASLE